MRLVDMDMAAVEARCVILATGIERMFMGRRELPIVIAHCLVKAKPGSPRMLVLNRLFSGLSTIRRAECRAELARCRRAISEQQEAVLQ